MARATAGARTRAAASEQGQRHVLVLNAGSSSLKAALFPAAAPARQRRGSAALIRLEVSGLKGGAARLRVRDGDGRTIEESAATGIGEDAHGDALAVVLDRLAVAGYPVAAIAAAGHRVVHGGTRFSAPIIVDAGVIGALDALAALAPHHMPPNIAGIRALTSRLPRLPQVACFDTAFHATQPPEATMLPLPREYRERGLRRYGFHGLSYAYIVEELARVTRRPLPERAIIAHLGNGASMCATRRGRSIATTMGFSTLDGLVMGTRCGSIDPGVLIELVRRDGLDAAGLEDLLYNRSGLLGLSGLSSDMKALLQSRDPAAREAVAYYCAAAARHAAGLMVSLGGCDAIVFTGGIGENAAPVRRLILERLAWAGVEIDNAANDAGAVMISTPAAKVSAWVVPTDEESMIARETRRLVLSPERPRRARPS